MDKYYNGIIKNIAGDFSITFVFILAVVIGTIITRWQNPKKKIIYSTVTILLIYMSMRYLGIGG